MGLKNDFLQVLNAFKPTKCTVCGEYIFLGQYQQDYWGQAAHMHHKISNCSVCGRILPENTVALPDGRKICNECKKSETKTLKQISWVENKIREVYTKNSIIGIPNNIPIKIVDSTTLSKHKNLSVTDPNLKGLVIYSSMPGANNYIIYVLDRLPKVVFAAILAHEMLHVWQYENKLTPPEDICEGFCNLGSYLVLSSIDKPLSKFYTEQLNLNPDRIYGGGYRKVKKTFDNKGLSAVLNKLKKYK